MWGRGTYKIRCKLNNISHPMWKNLAGQKRGWSHLTVVQDFKEVLHPQSHQNFYKPIHSYIQMYLDHKRYDQGSEQCLRCFPCFNTADSNGCDANRLMHLFESGVMKQVWKWVMWIMLKLILKWNGIVGHNNNYGFPVVPGRASGVKLVPNHSFMQIRPLWRLWTESSRKRVQ